MLALERRLLHELDWDALDRLPDRVVFQTREWLEFLTRARGVEAVVAELVDGDRSAGWFTGLVTRRVGIPILGSPFPGWQTPSMGFNLTHAGAREAVEALIGFSSRELRCLHLELKDPKILLDDLDGLGFRHSLTMTYQLDLQRSEDELFAGMSSACRRAVRKSERDGVTVEEAAPDGFAEEYHAQVRAVFARQSLRPPYPVDVVRELIRSVHPTGHLILLRARGPDDRSLATAIFAGLGRTAHFWGSGSEREGLIFRPNEALFWHGIRLWRSRGAHVLDFGGGGTFKRKYGCRPVFLPFYRRSRLPPLALARDVAERVARRGRR